MQIMDVIKLSELLGEMGHVKRATHLPNGEAEPDSHHGFSLALIAYHIVKTECPELDANKVMLYALVHDLLEIVTGDEDTQHFTPEQHAAKQACEEAAQVEFDGLFASYPELLTALHEYDKLDTPEAATVFVLDKTCTVWTWLHHHDMSCHAIERNIVSKADVRAWAERQRDKIARRLKVQPPQAILAIYEQSFHALEDLYEN